MTKTLKEIIDGEIVSSKKEYGERWMAEYFNNLCGKLPGGYLRKGVKDFPKMGNSKIWNDDSSEVLKKQTLNEFYRTIDSVIVSMGVNPDEIAQSQEKADFTKKYFEISKVIDLVEFTIKMREIGYKHYPDLVA